MTIQRKYLFLFYSTLIGALLFSLYPPDNWFVRFCFMVFFVIIAAFVERLNLACYRKKHSELEFESLLDFGDE